MIKNTCIHQIPYDVLGGDPSRAEAHEIKMLTVSPSEETLVATTVTNQLYCMTLSSADLGKVCSVTNFLLLNWIGLFNIGGGGNSQIGKNVIHFIQFFFP